MGRIVDLFGEVAAEADEGTEGLVLSPEAWERLREDWRDEDIEDALTLVHESLLQGELVDSADSLSTRLMEALGAFGEPGAFKEAEAGRGVLPLDVISHLARRVARLEEILAVFRDGAPPDRRGFDELQRRLMDVGIEDDMGRDREDDRADDEEE
ncbi:MAG TPA: hypothetical protein VFQ51_01185 [Vicinamibacteria bacterium]|nr:hypothetical protein [Vicinamibacteria bacterium]